MFVYKVTAFVLFIPVLLAKLHVTTSHILIWRLCLINKRFIGFITQTMKSYRDSPDSPSLEILINQTINSLSAQSTPNTHRERPSYEWRHKMGKLYKVDTLAIILLDRLGGWIIYNVPNPSKFFADTHVSTANTRPRVEGRNLQIAAKLQEFDCNVGNHVIRVDVRPLFFFFSLSLPNRECLILEQQPSSILKPYIIRRY